jgi:GNAT superfamily N-acetyltransferase
MRNSNYFFCELAASEADLELLGIFYRTIYVNEFPDPDERESLKNMENYLRLKQQGWYQKNNYHILLILDGSTPIAGAIIDYLALPNVGIIEFVVVSPSIRRQGLGLKLLYRIENMLDEDSRQAGYKGWSYMLAEMNDPFKTHGHFDSVDPFMRAMIWDRWGYKKLRFPYVQPSLSQEQEPVRNLLLICKPGITVETDNIPVSTLKDAIDGYAIWAMRINDPEFNPECCEMARFLKHRTVVELDSLARYIGDKSVRRLIYIDLTVGNIEDLDKTLEVYSNSFNQGEISLSKDLFKKFFLEKSGADKSFSYHLLSIKNDQNEDPKGMASFFSFPHYGFGGYLVFEPGLRGKGYLTEAITVIERHMAMDNFEIEGWFAECESDTDNTRIFTKRGFHEINIIYRQPPLPGQPSYSFDQAPVLSLIYKPCGDCFTPPRLAVNDFIKAIAWIFCVVYGINSPDQSVYYKDILNQLGNSKQISWK